jgi:hypothetical protein
MTETFSPQDEPELSGSILDFTPVPLQRRRYDGWSPEMQKRFIRALSVMGSVGAACRALGKGRVSAYRLREREGAESFAAAWDAAIEEGKLRQFDYFLERAMNGVTTVHIQRGGSVSVTGGPDMGLVRAAMAK